MHTHLECVPCIVRQALEAAQLTTADTSIHEQVLRSALRMVAEMPLSVSPPHMGQRIHRLLREVTGNADPYRQIKADSTALALQLYPDLKQRVRESADPFATAVALAIAGNIIDYGPVAHLDAQDVHRAVDAAVARPLDPAAVDALRRAIRHSQRILYVADNAGELVFDRVLIEQLQRDGVVLAVRGGPVINDATREDAVAAGLPARVPIVANGSDAPGTILDDCAPDFRAAFEQADVVIAKGQGNYETLSDVDREMFFLFKIKCPVVARQVGRPAGEAVIAHKPGPGAVSPRGGAMRRP